MTENVTLREHVEILLAERDRRYQERYEAQREAIAASERQRLRDHESQNQWREQFGAMERTLMPRRESQATTDAIEHDVDDLRNSDSNRTGAGRRGELTVLYLIAAAGPLMAGLGILVTIFHVTGH